MSELSSEAVRLRDVSHRYATRLALSNLNLHVPAGGLFGLLGPNGSGKTTLFRILSTLLRPSEGEALVFGHSTAHAPAAVRARLGVVFQQPALDDELTVEENLRIHGTLYGLSARDLSERLDDLLPRFGLAERRQEKPPVLSGGLRRRVDLVRGLLHRPALLLLDEPTTGLDPAARYAFWQVLDQLRTTEALTLIVATHLMDEAERCDEVAILDTGTLVTQGSPNALKQDLGTEAVWLTPADSPQRLAEQIRTLTGLPAQNLGTLVHVPHPEAPSLLSRLYDTCGALIQSATVRAPTLEDVFLAKTGQTYSAEPAPSPTS